MSCTNKNLFSVAMKRTSEWVFSQDHPSDLTVYDGATSFSLHKFPLVSKCGYIRKLLWQSTLSSIEIHNLPGGAEAFDLVTKFCYGVKYEISVHNVAMLRCAAEYLEMSEEQAVGNLVGKTEAYLSQVALQSFSGAVSVLHGSQVLLPMAENINLVRRCVDSLAYLVFEESEVDRWVRELSCLKIEFFQRVLVAMMARGFTHSDLAPVLMMYAHKSLRGLKGKEEIDPREEQRKRLVLETIVSLLPKEKHALPISFLSMLLHSSIYLDTTIACRLDLEKRIALQLDDAVLADLRLFDVDTMKRIMINYLENVSQGHCISFGTQEHHRVVSLMQSYLVEIALDRSLSTRKFIGLVELIDEESMVNENVINKAIDIFLKAHTDLTMIEMKSLCSLMDCHALEEPMTSITEESTLYRNGNRKIAFDATANLRRENEELRLELVNMKLKVEELKRRSYDKPPLPRKSLMNLVSKKLGKLNPLTRANALAPSDKELIKPIKYRRNSIS